MQGSVMMKCRCARRFFAVCNDVVLEEKRHWKRLSKYIEQSSLWKQIR